MGWAVGELDHRHIGYGVPATCDYPGCGASIDRGLAYACGGGVTEDVEGNCGLFFCSDHLCHWVSDEENFYGGGVVCERCANDQEPFDPTPDVAEWIEHVATDPSWTQFRRENPRWVSERRAASGGGGS